MHPDWLIRSNFRLRWSDNLHKDSHQNSWIYPRVINHPVPLVAMPIDDLKLLFLKAGKADLDHSPTTHMPSMDSICLVIDLEGFQLSKDSGAAFLVRELGWCKWDRTLSGNTQFDHGWRWRDLSKKDQKTVSYVIDRIHGLSFKPGAHEHYLPVSKFGELVMELHSKFSTPQRLLVAYKGGIQEKLLLDKLGLPYVNLEDFGCPGLMNSFRKKGHDLLNAVVISKFGQISSPIAQRKNVTSSSTGCCIM